MDSPTKLSSTELNTDLLSELTSPAPRKSASAANKPRPSSLPPPPPGLLGFAILRPLNHAAIRMFNAVAIRMYSQPAWALNARRFLVIDSTYGEIDTGQPSLADLDAQPDGDNDEIVNALRALSAATRAASQAPQSDRIISLNMPIGFYRLDIDVAPQSMEAGWVVGSSDTQADLLLAPTSIEASRSDLRSRHCQFAFGPVSDSLFIRSAFGAEVIVDGITPLYTQPRVAQAVNGLSFGSLQYVLSYTQNFPQHKFADQLLEMRRRRGWAALERPLTFTPTPSVHAITHQHWSIDKATQKGTFGSVSQGRHLRTASVVAAKRLYIKPANVTLVVNEIEALKRLKHVRIREYRSCLTVTITSPLTMMSP
jgi:hypothetical protein